MSILALQAQQLDGWQVYPAFSEAVACEVAGSHVYALYSGGNLLRYDMEEGSVRTYDCLRDVNDVHIAHIAWNRLQKSLLLVYDNSNIDILDQDDNVTNIPYFKENKLLSKKVNNIFMNGSMAYLCTDFGVLEVDMKEMAIRETYDFGVSVSDMAHFDGYYFFCNNTGIYRIADTANMHDKSALQQLATNAMTRLDVFDGRLVASNDMILMTLDRDCNILSYDEYWPKLVDSSADRLTIVSGNIIFVFRNHFDESCKTHYFYSGSWKDIAVDKGTYWVANMLDGLCAYELKDEQAQEKVRGIVAEGPVRDYAYHIYYEGSRLMVAGGINTNGAIYNAPTAMYQEGGKWYDTDQTGLIAEMSRRYPQSRVANTVDIVQDPNDAGHHYAAISRTGLAEFRNRRFHQLYNYDNSPLQVISIVKDIPQKYNYCTCTALKYDKDGILWMANQGTDTIVRFTRGKTWGSIYYDEINQANAILEYCFTRIGVRFLVSRDQDKRGIFGFYLDGINPTKYHRLMGTFRNQDGTYYSPQEYYCATEDSKGQVWIGTSDGPFLIQKPADFFDDDFNIHQIKVNRNDGSGLADYLLTGIPVTCITEDPAGRIWLGTQGSGVYLISADGQEQLLHFKAEDSPLLSDNINSIAVEKQSGLVMIATDMGLCSYQGDAIQPEASLDEDKIICYPNPVTSNYTGEVTIKGLVLDTEVKILSTNGQVVWAGRSVGGVCRWDCHDLRGARVSSGVYNVVANTSDGENAAVARIVIIR